MLKLVDLSEAPAEMRNHVHVLNKLLDLDGQAVSEIVLHRFPCNDALADAPGLYVACPDVDGGRCTLSGLGLLGAFINKEGFRLAVVTMPNMPHRVTRFGVMVEVPDE